MRRAGQESKTARRAWLLMAATGTRLSSAFLIRVPLQLVVRMKARGASLTACRSARHAARRDPEVARFCLACAAPLRPERAAGEQRKTVTVLFCDVTGSTALGESSDPEAFRSLLARYFERMSGITEAPRRHVGTFIGDAVMAVFGMPVAHEDDALRACRSALDMRDALPNLGLQARIGINTGEVVGGIRGSLATGDAVNVAARLQQAAQPGEILIGAETLRTRRRGRGRRCARAARAQGQVEPRARLPARRDHRAPMSAGTTRASSAEAQSSRRCGRRGSVSSTCRGASW